MQQCEVEACGRPVNQDDVCLLHKLKSVRWNGMHVMANERGANTSQGRMAQEIYDEAARTGTDIQQVRGRRTATQRFVNGVWK